MIGQTLGGYQIHERIGMGGMATVFKAKDLSLDRYVAIKVLHSQYTDNDKFRIRFELEARAISSLEHTYILPVYDHGEEDGIAYLVMRYVNGGTLKDLLEQGQMPFIPIYEIISHIASALDFAHGKGILHRDVKPNNILINRGGDATYLSDFGLAKIIEDSTTGLTGHDFLGTPRYMSPEQCSDGRDVSAASDQYSLGVVLYQMVTGRTPYNVSTPIGIINKHAVEAPFTRPCLLRPDLPLGAERVILKALSHNPYYRFSTCSEMAAAFKKASDTSVPVSTPSFEPAPWQMPLIPTPTPYPIERPKKLPMWIWVALICLLIGGGIGIFIGLLATRDDDSSRDSDSNNNEILVQNTATPTPPSAIELPSPTLFPTRTSLPTFRPSPTPISTIGPPTFPPTLTPSPTEGLSAFLQTATAFVNEASSSIKISVRNPGDIDLEGVGITNQAGSRDLSGWQLIDEDGNRFDFPAMQLSSSASLTVYSRSGQDTPAALYWSRSDPVWQNGEIGIVLDADGNEVAMFIVIVE